MYLVCLEGKGKEGEGRVYLVCLEGKGREREGKENKCFSFKFSHFRRDCILSKIFPYFPSKPLLSKSLPSHFVIKQVISHPFKFLPFFFLHFFQSKYTLKLTHVQVLLISYEKSKWTISLCLDNNFREKRKEKKGKEGKGRGRKEKERKGKWLLFV